MGAENNNQGNDLEGRISRLAKAPGRFLRDHGATMAVAAGIGAAYLGYLMIKHEKVPTFEELKDAFTNWDAWKRQIARLPFYAGGVFCAFVGVLALNNLQRKRKVKEQINIPKYLKRMFFPWTVGKGEKAFLEWLDCTPVPSTSYRGLANCYFGQGRVIEAMEAYYQMIRQIDDELTPKIPVIGTNVTVTIASQNIRKLEETLRANPGDNRALLELAMCYFSLNDFGKAVECVEKLDMEQDPVAFHIIASRLYSKASERAKRPRIRRVSFGTSQPGRLADKVVYFWDRWKKPGGLELKQGADKEALAAVEKLFERDDLIYYMEGIGDYSVYRIPLDGLVKGFVVVKEGDYGKLLKEMRNEQLFEQLVAGGDFRSVHPVTIIPYKGRKYLVLLYEDGTPLADSNNPEHYRKAMRFAARSDALMPLSKTAAGDYRPKAHFELRVFSSGLPEAVKSKLVEHSGFMFKYSDRFPVVFDGDWRPDGNCLVNSEEQIGALDKEDKGGTIGPVTAARLLNQGTNFTQDSNVKDGIAEDDYIPTYQGLADSGRRIDEPKLFLPVSATSTIEKAITAWCFTEDKPSQQHSAQVFVMNGLRSVRRLCSDRKFRKFYSVEERNHCRMLGEIIYEHILTAVP